MHDPSSTTLRGSHSRRGRPRILFDSPSHPDASALPNSLAPSRATTFTTSLSIPVEGATRITTSDSTAIQTGDGPQRAPISETRRAPRKSKTDALAALHTHARSSSVSSEDLGCNDSGGHDFSRPIPVSSRLDLSSVKTSSPRSLPPKMEPRPFDLEDCPVFYPTIEQFRDPTAYIRSISDKAKSFGLCKVVPPAEWKMPFVADTETFRFKTRLQQLNSIEASSRAKVNFLEQLYRFHKQQGNPRVAVPSINHKPLDLWLLRKEVHNLGGYDMVTKNKKWSDLGRMLGYGGIPGLSTQIKNSYTRVILPYEHFSDRVKNSLSPMTRDTRNSWNNGSTVTSRPSRLKAAIHNADDASPPSSPLSASSSPLSEPPDDTEYTEPNGNKPASSKQHRMSRNGSQEQGVGNPESNSPLISTALPSPIFRDSKDEGESSERAQENCEICHKKNREEEMLLCDGCDCGFHIFCLDPPLTAIPKGQWFCHTCLFGTGGDFGFDEGEEHTLASFQARDREFRRIWFESHPPPSSGGYDVDDPTVNRIGNATVSEYDLENEFWRLVQSQHETVEVEYGADVHSTTHGSAMPTMETHPLDPYSKDLWNLNNIPIVSESLLRFIKSDISGMTVPWTYVGMVFSTFCWHNEDHYTYSINFMHWGETKTWYGIPGEDAEKFEAAIKCEAPDLFEAQPDLLFQLVTLMNPKRLTEAGVRVYACNQRAGEFVITFPKAYHAGFNHGFNFNEAVNFALPDWLPFGRDCAQRYREHRKSPVFSHDELLITITQQSHSVKTAMWLIDSLNEMTQREMNDRKKAREMALWETLERDDRPEEQYQCMICKSFCYLSQVTCQCSSRVVCVDHAELLCDRGIYHLILRKRLSDEEILETQAKVAERAAIPSAWRGKLNKVLSESDRPQLRSLRALLAEGDRINYPLHELASLRRCVNRANEWVDAANTFLIRKQSRKRSRKRGRPPLHEPPPSSFDELGDRPDRGLDDLDGLLQEVANLGFDCPEIEALRALALQSENTQSKARSLLDSGNSERDREAYIQECEHLLLEGSSLNVNLDELYEVEKIVMREQLIKELNEKLDDDNSLTLEEVRQLLTRARACNLPPENIQLRLLKDMLDAGDHWEGRARKILAQPYKTIDELDQISDMIPDTPFDPAVLDRLMTALAKAREFEKQAKVWLAFESEGVKPKVQDALRLVARAEKDFIIPAIHDLKSTADIALDLETRCEQVLNNRYHHRPEAGEESDVFNNTQTWKAYARDHLKMFTLPAFEKLDRQLTLHYAWLEGLPWYCYEHQEAHSQQILEDVVESSRQNDDLPPSDEYFTCICTTAVRPPPTGTISDAVQCDHCFARFHGVCAANGGSCPFCDHHHWNGAIHKARSWHSCFLSPMLASAPEITQNYSPDWKMLEVIVHRLDRLSTVIGQFLSYASVPGNQQVDHIPQVRHYMRKLYKIQFAVSPHREVSLGLDLAGLHRLLAGQPAPVRMKKRRRPRFSFGPDVDNDWLDGTRCICRGRSRFLLNYPVVQCEMCARSYHARCVFVSAENFSGTNSRFTCPLCCLRKNRTYTYSHVRVKPMEDVHEPNTYVDITEMLNTFSKEIIYEQLGPPHPQTIVIKLVRFTPGQPDNAVANGGGQPRTGSNSSNRQSESGVDTPHSRSNHASNAPTLPNVSTFDVTRAGSDVGHHVPPPPPWSRWGTMSTPSRPPSTQRRQPAETPRGTPQPPKKRKHAEDNRPNEEVPNPNGSLSSSRSPKRRTLPPPPSTPPPAPSSSRPIQTLSPSLAMIVSPPDKEHSPRQSSSSFNAPGSSISTSSSSMPRRVELGTQEK